jgi:predicted DNA-binding transcriptional regulator YafY
MTPRQDMKAGNEPRRRSTAETQLERLLYILPAAARGEGVPIRELAAALDVDDTTVLRDLQEATARSFHHPGGSTEAFTITIFRGRVHVHAPDEFRRPVRLTQREALALGLGLRSLAADEADQRRADIIALARRLECELAAPDAARQDDHAAATSHARAIAESDVEYDALPLALAFDDDGFRGLVADAIELRCTCDFAYLKPGSPAPALRRVAPWRLVYADGTWYAAAHDMDRDEMRFFRLDRVLAVTLHDGQHAPPPPPDLDDRLRAGAPFIARDDVDVSVHYSPAIARWICERVPCAGRPDGSAVLSHRVADERWLVRHVLQYGGEAMVVEPPAARQWVAAAAEALIAAAAVPGD